MGNYSPNKQTVICFPFAGGYSVSFSNLSRYLNNQLNVIAIEPPGHGTNRLPLIDDIEELIDLYIEKLDDFLKDDVILFGHSMGGFIVFRLVQKLEKMNITPRMAFLSACSPPHLKFKKVSHLSNKEFIDYLVELGGISQELLEEKELLDFFLPVIRADFKAIETFQPLEDISLSTRVHILNGKLDHKHFNQFSEWEHWLNNYKIHEIDGAHMFINSHPEQVSNTILSELQ
ncbi:thioesterase II family protein [Bacillus cereus group sp. TH152-1LC]|uniref:thioesterase II family protein n=1 Tax=Bacillus cereus group sp. TH152-1LC TaxID=3018060 RepID=UPI0022E9236F|nr:alpha/beta fold hydrolase [Bacillus cereus group sp. TH152-1LC]MDA1677499.1 alpha/beta fold hydrolase [Bacillus cereus group sp. TH152-1LC]